MAYDVAVIGAGVFGSWTAWHLRLAGASVLLVDAWGAGHWRASSGGESRIIRMGYGADEIYTRMAMRSLILWRELFEGCGERLFRQTGVLWMARERDPYSAATRENWPDAACQCSCSRQTTWPVLYPQMRLTDPAVFGIFEP